MSIKSSTATLMRVEMRYREFSKYKISGFGCFFYARNVLTALN